MMKRVMFNVNIEELSNLRIDEWKERVHG
jgi:hypothetical protein